MISKHLLKMLLGLVITGVIGIVSLFLINEYDKKGAATTQAGALSSYSSNLPTN